jgi:hypothetical protein
MKKETKNMAKIEILNYVIQFCTTQYYGNNSFSIGRQETSFHGSTFDKQNPPIGSLCMLQAAPTSVFYLGWLREIKEGDNRYSTQYLLESIEDGSKCWWSNVGIWHLPLETSNRFPNWQWNDSQFEFQKKYDHIFRKRCAYGLRALLSTFKDDGSVTVKIRKMWSNDVFAEKTFENYKKVLQRDLLKFYDETEIKYNSHEKNM